MTIRRLLLIFGTIIFCYNLIAGGVREELLADPLKSGNNLLAYPDRDLPALTPAPDDYKAFFINHYGRHGSRWLLFDKNYSRALETLELAGKHGKLTNRGRQVLDTLRMVYNAADKRFGDLTDIGAEQHQGIAQRMFINFPEVFSNEAAVNAHSTTVIRCILSMQNETDMLKGLNPRLHITTEASYANMHYMNLSTPEIESIRGEGLRKTKIYRDKWVKPSHMLNVLFNDQQWVDKNVSNAQELMLDLFDIAGNMQSHHDWEQVDFYDLFSADDIYNLFRYNNAHWYIGWGESPFTKYPMDFTQDNLLRNFIAEADSAIAQRVPKASLRFGHESVLLPLVCLMGLDGADYRTTDFEHLDDHWVSYRIFPMACNLQMIYYQSATKPDDVILKILLNEHEATLPITTDIAPYYHWNDVRNYFTNKLSHRPSISQTNGNCFLDVIGERLVQRQFLHLILTMIAACVIMWGTKVSLRWYIRRQIDKNNT